MWRPYGTVVGYEGEVCLLMENGTYQRQPDARSPAVVVSETWFGPGPSEFRVASLPGVDNAVQTPSNEPSAIRFHAYTAALPKLNPHRAFQVHEAKLGRPSCRDRESQNAEILG